MEVAEHLLPASSEFLIYWLTKLSPVVIFSAAVPEQGGHGHINCQPLDYWQRLFESNNFKVQDRIRSQIRGKENVAIWYKLNILDYVNSNVNNIRDSEVIANLIASDSYASSEFYKTSSMNLALSNKLSYKPIKGYLKLRNVAKKIFKNR
jgi:hypothetical protein